MIKFILLFIIFSFNVAIASNDIVASIDNFAITRYDLNNLKKMFNSKDGVIDDYILILKKRFIALNNDVSLTDSEKKLLESRRNNILKQIKANPKGVDDDFISFIIESNYLWTKYVELKLKPTINIKDSYIDNVIEYMDKNNIKTKYNLSEIVLYYNESNKKDIEKKINNIYKELTVNNFETIASSTSQSLSAKNNGSIGWVFETDLNKNIIDVIKNTKNISKPACFGDSNGVCIIFKVNSKDKIYDVSDESRLQIKNFIFLQLLESKISDILNKTNFTIKYDYNK